MLSSRHGRSASLPRESRHDEQRFVLQGVPWWTYVALRDALDDHAGLKLTYLEGTLELMRPSLLHEETKTIIARLLEIWAVERRVDLRGFGSTTFRREARQRGLEPDECYKLGKLSEDGEYQRRERSEVLPTLDLAELARFVQPGENQTELVRAYQAVLRAR